MNPNGEIPEFRRRYRYLVAFVGLTFTILWARLCQLQVVNADYYLKLSTDNFVQQIRIPTVRGVVMDRKRRPLVTNRPSYDVFVTPRFATEASIDRLIDELSLSPKRAAALREAIENVTGSKRFQPQLAVRDISRDQLARVETHMGELDGVVVMARAHRNYLHGNLSAHVLGYMNEVTANELGRDSIGLYQSGDLVGRYGVERMYEDQLRGVPGREHIVVDARGRRKHGREVDDLLRGERRIEPIPGHNLVLTLDLEVQRLVERALRRYDSGAAVVLEVNTGRILASASRPGFDPNVMTGRLSPGEAQRLLSDPYRPLLDKVFRENYFPGSTYKVIPAIAALEEGKVVLDDTIECKGWHHFGRRTFRCGHSHGKKVNLYQAIVESCNVFFYTLAETVGMDTMAHYARLFGLGAPTGVGLNGEVPGFIPTKAWYASRRQPFRIGFTLNAAIGQGNTKTSPIQIASLYATIANNGTLYLPQIVERIETNRGQMVMRFSPRIRRQVSIQPDTLDLIQRALHGVVHEPKGTAYDARIEEIQVSGKTGTAQVSRRARKGKTIWLQDHSWFAAYAPSDHPVIAVAVIIEHGGRAAKVAAPVVMEIIRGYFRYVAPNMNGPKTADARSAMP